MEAPERFARRFLIPYIDLGMDIHQLEHGYTIAGQVVLSSPDGPCLWCYGILTDERLAREAGEYGKVGSRPQVVWSNGILASIAVGLLVQLVQGERIAGFILITGIDGTRYALGQQSVAIIHDADECHDETLVVLHGGAVVRVPCSLDEVLVWFS